MLMTLYIGWHGRCIVVEGNFAPGCFINNLNQSALLLLKVNILQWTMCVCRINSFCMIHFLHCTS